MFRHLLAIGFALAIAACGGSPTSPEGVDQASFGRLSGVVTLAPNCPGENPSSPCPTPPGAFALRKVLVYDAAATKLLHTVDIDAHGFFLIDLPAGEYTVDLKKSGADSAKDLPRKVMINRNLVTSITIAVDTGIR